MRQIFNKVIDPRVRRTDRSSFQPNAGPTAQRCWSKRPTGARSSGGAGRQSARPALVRAAVPLDQAADRRSANRRRSFERRGDDRCLSFPRKRESVLRKPVPHGTGTGGVTLIELLAVLGIVAMLGTVFTVMFGSLDRSYRTMKSTMDIYENARLPIARMRKELASTLMNQASGLGLRGSESDISFHTVISTGALTADETSSDVVAVRYALAEGDENILSRFLVNADGHSFPSLPIGETNRADLAEGITDLAFEYFASASDYESGNAAASWDSFSGGSGVLPALIRIKLSVQDAKKLSAPRVFQTVVHLRNAP